MATLSEIQAQIKQLQAQEAEIKAKELDAAVQDIVAKMQAFGISVNDLNSLLPAALRGKARAGSAEASADSSKKRSSISSVAAKYRGPNGETWSGRGLTPRWLATLVADGKNKEDFAITA
ncbi:H-NS family nucleoid-associated regulatory protein [Rhodoferax aquaticus]|uniref:H-NS histone family protein n=1 Tax=Rhodoferax aquaticus TaxID=2527691 RepID=A0A515ELC1_9BURK|nr:H-NS histone family protein [Rhodoferax aquaticus]QDL53419.1 H-NS histone family protein [Rhodoferax aquaticus]